MVGQDVPPYTEYLGQRSFNSKVNDRGHTHTYEHTDYSTRTTKVVSKDPVAWRHLERLAVGLYY